MLWILDIDELEQIIVMLMRPALIQIFLVCEYNEGFTVDGVLCHGSEVRVLINVFNNLMSSNNKMSLLFPRQKY